MNHGNFKQVLTDAEFQIATTVSSDPTLLRIAKEFDSFVDTVGSDTPGALAAYQRLEAAVSEILRLVAPGAKARLQDFVLQAVLFTVGTPFFIKPAHTEMAEWIVSMPDAALAGLRGSMVKTATDMGREEDAARFRKISNKVLASLLANSAPNAISGVITDLDDLDALLEEEESSNTPSGAVKLAYWDAEGAGVRSLSSIAMRQARLLSWLRKYSFHSVATLLSSLLIRRENHTATSRIELLLHIAAMTCKGNARPGLRELRKWLKEIENEPLVKLEVPVEDVFVSNVQTNFGNARLFQGRWRNNADLVDVCIEVLFTLANERAWAREAIAHITALLRLSETLAERAGVARYTSTESNPGDRIVLDSLLNGSNQHVVFNDMDLAEFGVRVEELHPFILRNEDLDTLATQSIGHSALERRPLLHHKKCAIVALPSAFGVAIRRYAIEQATTAGNLALFQTKWHVTQFTTVFSFGHPCWKIKYEEMPEPEPNDGIREFIGTFDRASYVHLVFVPDDFETAANAGVASSRSLDEHVLSLARLRANTLSEQGECRKGLTIFVHGGVGRRCSIELENLDDLPDDWYQVCVSYADFLLLGNKSDFNTLRAWKLLRQIRELNGREIYVQNLRGFFNLVAYVYHVGFELVPDNLTVGTFYLHNDFLLPISHEIQTRIDRHASIGPDGSSWITVQRHPESASFDKIQGRGEYYSPNHMAQNEVLVCVESDLRPWWIRISDPIPEGSWHHSIVFSVVAVLSNWLTRVSPALEERFPTLPSGPVCFGIRFAGIENFGQQNFDMEQTPESPGVTLAGQEIMIDCQPGYLRSFLSSGNLGDRLMVTAMARGIELLCGGDPLSSVDTEKWVQSITGTEKSHFLKMNISSRPDELIYDNAVLPEARLPMPEDIAWSRLGLAHLAGYKGEFGLIPPSHAVKVLNQAVECVWRRIASHLAKLSRESTIERAMLNYIAASQDHKSSLKTIAPRLALYDAQKVMGESIGHVAKRDKALLTCRVITEMALCTAPYGGSYVCTDSDLDYLMAEIWTLVECANQSDALRYGLSSRTPTICENGSFKFDESVVELSTSVIGERWRRVFRDSADELLEDGESLSHEFQQAFEVEFGITPNQYGQFIMNAANQAVESHAAFLSLPKSEVAKRLRDVGVSNPGRVFSTLVLQPRIQWDEEKPNNANEHDWYPWRFNRRLSVLRRPLIQLSTEEDPIVLVAPSLLCDSLGYLAMAEVGGLPETLFDSQDMISLVGKAVDKRGHEFERKVERKLKSYGWKTASGLAFKQFGGPDLLGDVDVLCWDELSGLVYVLECKSLRADRSIREIGMRLLEYSKGEVDGQRTPLQKHLDRMSFFKSNRGSLSKFTSISTSLMRIRSGLVTEGLGPLQFVGDVIELLDIVTDFELLEERFTKD